MPYIEKNERIGLDYGIDSLVIRLCVTDDDYVGQFNYTISRMLNGIIAIEGLSYTNINKLIGVLECAKLELYRRVATPYEEEKCETNGEVYDLKKPTIG